MISTSEPTDQLADGTVGAAAAGILPPHCQIQSDALPRPRWLPARPARVRHGAAVNPSTSR